MKRKIVCLSITIILLSILFSGCNEPEPTFITVNELLNHQSKYNNATVNVQGLIEQYVEWNPLINDNVTKFRLWNENKNESVKLWFIEGLRELDQFAHVQINGVFNADVEPPTLSPKSYTIL